MIRIDCGACAAPLDVGMRHRGRRIRCPGCGAEVPVPRELDFRAARQDSAEDRRAGTAALSVAIAGTAICVGLPVCAAVWWWTSRRIERSAREGRVPPESLLGARVVAATGLVAQLAFWSAVAL